MKKEIKSLTREEANNLCYENGVRNENFNMVGGILWERIKGKWTEIKDFNEKKND